jgi:hypothetical protein
LTWLKSFDPDWHTHGEDDMRHTGDRPPIQFMVIARLIRMRAWSRANLVEFGFIATTVSIAAIRLAGEQWWFAAVFGVLSGIAAVLFILPEREEYRGSGVPRRS